METDDHGPANLLRGLVWLTTLIGLGLRATGAGLLLIGYWYVYLILAGLHLAANLRAIRTAGANVAQVRPYVIASQILFVAGMLLQFDVGDGPVFMVGAELLGFNAGFGQWTEMYDISPVNVLVFLPCVLSWLLALRAGTRTNA